MARIPTAVETFRAPTPRGGVRQFSAAPVDFSPLGDAARAVGQAATTVSLTQQQNLAQDEKFNASARFLEFQTQQQQKLRDMGRDAQPGAFGFTQSAQEEYKDAADEFARSLPKNLRREYDVRLQNLEGKLLLNADSFESQARTGFYNDTIEKSFEGLRAGIIDGDIDYDAAIAQGAEIVANSGLTPTEKLKFAESWERDAAAALWRKEFNEDPQRALVAAGGGTEAQRMDYQRGNLFSAMIKQESGGNPNAVSPVGATGIMQVMPATGEQIAREIGDPNFPTGGTVQEQQDYLKDPDINKAYGEYYMNKQLDRFGGDVEAALIAYNAGPGNAQKWLDAGRDYDALPKKSETQPYVRNILGDLGLAQGLPVEAVTLAANGPADPRFEALDIDTRLKLIGSAAKAVDQIGKAERTAAIDGYKLALEQDPFAVQEDDILNDLRLNDGDRASLLSKRDAEVGTAQTDRVGELELDIATNPAAVSQKDILEDGLLDDGQKAGLVNKLKAALKDYDAQQADVAAYRDGVQGNPYSTDDRKSVDNAWKSFDVQPESEKYALSALSVVQRRGVMPGPVVENIRGTMLRGNIEQAVAMLELASKAEDISTGSMAGRSGSDDVRNAIAEYNYWRKLDFSPEEAATNVINARQPGAEQVAVPKDVQKKIEKIDLGDVEGLYDETINPFTADPEAAPGVAAQTMVAEYRDIVLEHYQQTGDLETAKARAEAQFKRTYNVSNATGKPQIMRYPPEAYYPAFEGNQDYLATQLQESVTQAFGANVNADSVSLVAVPGVTDVDVRLGRPPRYGVIAQREDGTFDVLPENVYMQFDPATGEQETTQSRIEETRQRSAEFEESALRDEGFLQPDGSILLRVKTADNRKGGVVVNVDTKEIYAKDPDTGDWEPTGGMYKTKGISEGFLTIDNKRWTKTSRAEAIRRQERKDKRAQARQELRDQLDDPLFEE
jgi:hypothetical protein